MRSLIQKRKEARVTLLDIINFNQTDLKLILYHGKNIPFPDNSFDTSLLIFTLHHCNNPLKVLEEAERVTKEKLSLLRISLRVASLLNKIFLYLWDIWSGLLSLIKPLVKISLSISKPFLNGKKYL